MRGGIRSCLGVFFLLIPMGCSGSGGDVAAFPTFSPSAEFLNGGECPPDATGEIPEGFGCVSRIEADADGDGTPDTMTVYAGLDQDLRPSSWRMQLKTASGGEIEEVLRAGNPYSYPRAIGAADINGDGSDEWFIKVHDLTSHGAPWSTLNVFILIGNRLLPIRFEGAPLDANYGGIARLGEGIECSDGHLILVRAEAQNVRNTRWRTSRRTFAIDGNQARFLDREEGLLHIDDYNDPALDPFYAVDCNGLRYPD